MTKLSKEAEQNLEKIAQEKLGMDTLEQCWGSYHVGVKSAILDRK